VDLPCCYLRASQDRLVPAACSAWFERKFTRCELNEIDGPHFLLQTRPMEAAQAIARFMNGLDGE